MNLIHYILSGEKPAGSREQAVFHSRQDHGARLRHREDQGLQHVQVPQGSSLINISIQGRYRLLVALRYSYDIHGGGGGMAR